MEKQIIFASNNVGKIKEVQEILKDFHILSQSEAGIDIDVIEDGNTFSENAIKKAVEIAKISGKPCIADDSGLCIDFLDGFPGVKTKRFLGEEANDIDRNTYLINQLRSVPFENRTVHFVCSIAFAMPNEEIHTFEESLDGFLATSRRGENGFGFDEIFELPNGKTLAELSTEEKLEISSRRKALEKLKDFLVTFKGES